MLTTNTASKKMLDSGLGSAGSAPPYHSIEIIPGSGVKQFKIGMSLDEVIRQLRRSKSWMTRVEFCYSDADPLGMDFRLHIPSCGMQLSINSRTQRLKAIDIRPNGSVDIFYRKSCLSTPSQPISYQVISEILGPTTAGMPYQDMYAVVYDGLCVFFPLPTALRSLVTLGKDITNDLLRNPELTACFFRVFPSGSDRNVESLDGSSGRSVDVLMRGDVLDCFFESPPQVQVCLPPFHQNAFVLLPNLPVLGSTVNASGKLSLGDSCQDVLSLLGRSNGSFETPVRGVLSDESSSSGKDYVFNYFEHGIDVLFDGGSHTVKKIILHTNFPGHTDFTLYHKCNYVLYLPTHTVWQQLCGKIPLPVLSNEPVGDLLGIPEFAPVSLGTLGFGYNHSKAHVPLGEPVAINVDMKWEEIQGLLGRPINFEQPILNGRLAKDSPFSSTEFFGHGHVIFEVMANDYIASVTIFNADAKCESKSRKVSTRGSSSLSSGIPLY